METIFTTVETTNRIFNTNITLIFILTTTGLLSFSTKTIKQTKIYRTITIILFIIIIIFNIFYPNYSENNNTNTMINSIEKTSKITNLKLIESSLQECDQNYNGSINSATWMDKKKEQKIGLLIGVKNNEQCTYTLKHIGNDNSI